MSLGRTPYKTTIGTSPRRLNLGHSPLAPENQLAHIRQYERPESGSPYVPIWATCADTASALGDLRRDTDIQRRVYFEGVRSSPVALREER